MSLLAPSPRSDLGAPAWSVAELFPTQGKWTEDDYLALPGNRLVELCHGVLEVLPMPTMSHQMIVAFLFQALVGFIKGKKLGRALFAGLPVRLGEEHFREPDIVFMLREHAERMGEEYWEKADLVMEVVSGEKKGRRRDLTIKLAEYEQARIPEYWIVDPQKTEITVLRLKGKKYVVHGKFRRGQRAASVLLKGFEVDVDAVFSDTGD